jgi:Sigma-70 factor, region 1.2
MTADDTQIHRIADGKAALLAVFVGRPLLTAEQEIALSRRDEQNDITRRSLD